VVVIAPHPDDEVAGCGGVLLRHRAGGDRVSVFYATDGSGTRAFRGIPHGEIGKKRAAEAERARAILGIVRHRWLGLREWHWNDRDLAGPLHQFLSDEDPGVIYVPSLVDFHPEHIKVARVVGQVLENRIHETRTLRIYPVQVPLTSLLVNLVAPIAEVYPSLRQAGSIYASQEGSLRAPFRLKRYAALRHNVPDAAEEFWELDAAAYSTLHRTVGESRALGAFPGLRRLAVTDPIAFLSGRARRRRLRRLVAS
jgi:LmbE family N-acetylglucosaminyl deacetylase